METASQDKVTHEDLDRAADEATAEDVVEVEAAAEEEEVIEDCNFVFIASILNTPYKNHK